MDDQITSHKTTKRLENLAAFIGLVTAITVLTGMFFYQLTPHFTPAPIPSDSAIPAPGIQTISDEEMAQIVNLEATLANLHCGEVRMLPLPNGVILANGEVRLQTICFRLGNLETDQTLHMVIERQVLVTYDDKAGRIFVVITAKGTSAWLGTAPGVERTELDSSALLKVTGLNAYVNEYHRKAKTVEFDLNRATGAISNVVLTDGAE